MGGLGCQGSFIPTVVVPCLSLGGETEQAQMGLKGFLRGVGVGMKALQGLRVGTRMANMDEIDSGSGPGWRERGG